MGRLQKIGSTGDRIRHQIAALNVGVTAWLRSLDKGFNGGEHEASNRSVERHHPAGL
jgi:hypothetical protein